MRLSMGILLTTIVFSSTFTFANDELNDIMKKMGRDFKTLTKQINDPNQNISSTQLAENISTLMKSAVNEVPDSVANLAPADQPAALAEFQNEIKKVMAEIDQMIVALKASDNAMATSILNLVAQQKKDAHNKFDPKP